MLTTIRSLVDKFFGENEEQHSLVSSSEEMKSIEAELEKIQSSAFTKTTPEVVEQLLTEYIQHGHIPALNEEVTNAVKTLLEYNPTAVATIMSMIQPKVQSPIAPNGTTSSHLSLRSAAEQSFFSSL
jgi:uncharacterized coiled-coil DUF342 family protein